MVERHDQVVGRRDHLCEPLDHVVGWRDVVMCRPLYQEVSVEDILRLAIFFIVLLQCMFTVWYQFQIVTTIGPKKEQFDSTTISISFQW